MTEKTIKVSPENWKRLQQYKLDHDLKSIDQTIEQLLPKEHKR